MIGPISEQEIIIVPGYENTRNYRKSLTSETARQKNHEIYTLNIVCYLTRGAVFFRSDTSGKFGRLLLLRSTNTLATTEKDRCTGRNKFIFAYNAMKISKFPCVNMSHPELKQRNKL